MRIRLISGVLGSLLLIQACGSSSESEEKAAKEAVDSSTKVTAFSKTIRYKEDSLFALSCNPYFVSFLTDATNTCKAVTTNVDLSTSIWTIKSADGLASITGEEGKDETLTIAGSKYFCFLASGTLVDSAGKSIYSGSHLIVASEVATKPSDIKPASIKFIGFSDGDACLSMQ